MKTPNNIPSSFDDVVFENRNKLYGAYALRRSYNGNLLKAVLISSLILLLLLLLATRKWTQEQLVIIKQKADSIFVDLPPTDPYKEKIAVVKPQPTKSQRNNTATQTPEEFSPEGKLEQQIIKPHIQLGVANKAGLEGPGVVPGDWEGPGDGGETTNAGTGTGVETSAPVRIVEENPEFPGGIDAMTKYLVKYLQKDDTWREMGLSGKVYVDFVVDNQGNIVEVKAISGPYELLKKTSERAIKSMPKWKPGRQNGHAVPVILTIPISFVIN